MTHQDLRENLLASADLLVSAIREKWQAYDGQDVPLPKP
jgi:hypothetical protein